MAGGRWRCWLYTLFNSFSDIVYSAAIMAETWYRGRISFAILPASARSAVVGWMIDGRPRRRHHGGSSAHGVAGFSRPGCRTLACIICLYHEEYRGSLVTNEHRTCNLISCSDSDRIDIYGFGFAFALALATCLFARPVIGMWQ